jgi:hypothetical protein
MAARPMLVIATIPYGQFTYDGVPNNVILRGTVIDVPAGSALNTALGAYITAMTAQQCQPGSSDSVSGSGMSNIGGNGAYAGTVVGQSVPISATYTTFGGSPFAWPQ